MCCEQKVNQCKAVFESSDLPQVGSSHTDGGCGLATLIIKL
jgi:hypothetical protein